MIVDHLYTEGAVGSDYPEQIKAQIAGLRQDAELIIHHIKSPGGDVYAAWKAIPELMKIGKPIKSFIEGEASSIASWIAIAPASEVEAIDPSTMLIHEPFYPEGIDQPLRIDDLEGAKTELAQIRQSMAEAYARKSGKTVEEMLAVMKNNTRLTAKMAQAMGLVDKVTMTEPRRIAAEVIDEVNKKFETLKSEFMGLFGKKIIAAAPIAVDLATTDGKMVHVESETGDLVNKPATVDGAPAEGSYVLADGRTLVCTGGMVTEVKQGGTIPEETEAQRLQKQLQAVQAQLNQAKAAEEARVKAEEDAKKAAAEAAKAEETAKALKDAEFKIAALAQEMEEMKKKPVGDQSNPNNMSSQPAAFAVGITSEDKKAIMASRSFLADNLPHFERYYKSGKYPDGTRFIDYRTGGPNAVSILETNFTYTWQGELTLDLFYKPTLSTPSWSDIATIDTGSKDKKRYNIVPALNKILKPYTGCDQAVTGTKLEITDKYIQLKPFRMKEKWCQDDFTDRLTGTFNHLAQAWLKDGNQGFDPAGTPIDRIIMNALKDSLRRDTYRRIMLADTTSSSADWNQIDGLISTLIKQSGASNYCVYRYGSALGTGTLADGTANTYLTGMWEGSNILLKEYGIDTGKAVIFCTRSIWDNYYKYLVGVGAVTEQAYSDYKNGLKTLEFRGIPLKAYGILDSFLADSTCPLNATTRHFAALTVPENHIIGVENTPDLGAIKTWFSDDDNVRYYSSQMTMGVLGALHCELTTIAY